ncbi:glutathione S-transferase YfcF [Pseudomonas sp. StFLB209]|uniref:glutathione transferase n=1 Tax=Pseudomonas sp. StFLB209 TaxID=1028989 RepID=UPI0004F6C69A|nr:glutathione transferase [Pseudomonas sp. StFLB209]BAP45533.1 glutathione S-transferase YfcF [Pseudomonas sp. StFLB209]
MSDDHLLLHVDSHYTSPWALAVFVTLREKHLPFSLRTLDLDRGDHQAPDYIDLSLTRRVPTLVQGDFALSESSAVIEYLEDSFAEHPVLPTDRQLRARARQIQAWLRSDLLPIRQERSTLVVFYGQKVAAPLSANAQAAADKLIKAAQSLLADGRDYLFGNWSIVDVELAVTLNRLILNGDPVPQALVEYTSRQWQHPAVQEWLNLQRPAL